MGSFCSCPACGGDGWEYCELCTGEGIVTLETAQAWRDSIDAWVRQLGLSGDARSADQH